MGKILKIILWSMSIPFAYVFFVNIPIIYEAIPNSEFLRVGAGHTRLNSTTLTNFIYLLLFTVAIFGLMQIKEARKARTMTSLSAFFRFIYDETAIKYKKNIREYKIDFESLLVTDDVNQATVIIRKFEKKMNEFENIAKIMTLYNNIGLLVDREHLDLEDLPSIFPKNVVIYWNIFEPYIKLRRVVDREFEIETGKTITYDFYAEHFENLNKKCKKYLEKKYSK